LNSAASRVAVPLATSARSHAASAAWDRPVTMVRWRGDGPRRASSLMRDCRFGTAGITNQVSGWRRSSTLAAARKRPVSDSISEARLPGSSAMTLAPMGRPSAVRAAAWSGSIGITLASGWPTYVAAMPWRASSSGSNGKMHSTWSQARFNFSTRLARQAQIDGQTKWTVFTPPERSFSSSARLKSGASTPMKTSGRSRSSRSRSDSRRRSSSGRCFRTSA
jgi:hypothetical protein